MEMDGVRSDRIFNEEIGLDFLFLFFFFVFFFLLSLQISFDTNFPTENDSGKNKLSRVPFQRTRRVEISERIEDGNTVPRLGRSARCKALYNLKQLLLCQSPNGRLPMDM